MSEIEAAEALVVQPGDTLLVRVAGTHFNPQHAQTVRERLMHRLPLLADVVVIGCDQIAVVRPENNKQPEDQCQPPSKTRRARTKAAEAPPRTAPAKDAAQTK